MFAMFDGYGSELAAVLWIVVIPSLIVLFKWYSNYSKKVALGEKSMKEVREELKEIKKECQRFNDFIVSYEAYKQAMKNGAKK